MLKLLTALFIAFLFALIAFAWVETYSPSFQNCVQERTSNNASSEKSKVGVVLHSYVGCTGQFADKHNSLITAIGTVLLAVVTFGLILGGIDQQRTTRAQLRGYVTVEPGTGFRQSKKFHIQFEFRPNIVNVGQTPASEVEVLSKLDFIKPPIPVAFDFTVKPDPKAPPGARGTLGVGKDKFHANIFGRRLTWTELREHSKGKKCFHLWGRVTYKDIFKVRRYTYFSFLILVPTRKTAPMLWITTDRHNYFT
jgi:hypothetical protein